MGVGAASAGAATVKPRVLGGVVTGNERAPFVASVATGAGRCTGVILAPRRVWTAAHCLSRPGNGQTPAENVTVRVGVVNRDGEGGQTVGVAEVRRHPFFVQDVDEVQPDDVAELRLAEPLTLSAQVQPIEAAAAPAAGTPLTLYGYGTQGSAPDQDDGRLRRLGMSTLPPEQCSAFNAIQLCYRAPDGSTCPGDSGGPVTSPRGGGEVLVAINNGGSCAAGTTGIGAEIGAPELARFLAGDDAPPRAPRGGRVLSDPVYTVVGQTVVCHSDGFSGTGPLVDSAVFSDQDAGSTVQNDGTTAHRFVDAEVGRFIGCRVSVSGPGGTYQSGLLRASRVVQALRLPGLGITQQSGTLRFTGTTDAATVLLTTTDVAGGVRDARTIAWPSPSAPSAKLPTGRYETCVASAQTVFFAPGRACAARVVSGKLKALTRARRSRRRGSRFSFSFRVRAPARRLRVKVVQRVYAKGHRTRRTVRRLTLKSTTRFRSSRVRRGGKVRAVVLLPSSTIDGVPYKGGSLVFARRQPR